MLVHVIFGAEACNQIRALAGQPPLSLAAFVVSAKVLSSTLQTRQAEYLVIALYAVLGIFLREEGSAESKPAGASEATAGEHNK